MTETERQLQQEREKLDRLVDEALQNGTPISETHEIMKQFKKVKRMVGEVLKSKAVIAQSRRVDRLVVQVAKETKPKA